MTTHVNPDSIRGADAVASVVYMARTGSTKEEIKDYVQRIFGYDLSRSCAEVPARPTNIRNPARKRFLKQSLPSSNPKILKTPSAPSFS